MRRDPSGGRFELPGTLINKGLFVFWPADRGQWRVNMDRTDSKIDTLLTRAGSGFDLEDTRRIKQQIMEAGFTQS